MKEKSAKKQIKLKVNKYGWVKVVFGKYPITHFKGPSALLIKESWAEPAVLVIAIPFGDFTFDRPLIIGKGQYFKLKELKGGNYGIY